MAQYFDQMPPLRSSPPSSPPSSSRRQRRSLARKLERCCCQTFQYIPLLFVYGLTSWAIWVAAHITFFDVEHGVAAYLQVSLVTILYVLANLSYTIAIFILPGSPMDKRADWSQSGNKGRRGGYEGLPTHEHEGIEYVEDPNHHNGLKTVTAKSSGKQRYCKKCQCLKPDRAHHCSTCRRCVLKMDHHCPWLATCIGLHNYKPFLLFLAYTTLFCWSCFALSARWVWVAIVSGRQIDEGLRVVNTILLAVLGGVVGLVLSGFTGWHIHLTVTNQTTIESLEKTRYLSPLRKTLEHQFQTTQNQSEDTPHRLTDINNIATQLKDMHLNALPGILRPEEGEVQLGDLDDSSASVPYLSSGSSAKDHLQRSFASMEAQRDRERYDAYLDERDSERLPNAFDVGWKRNLLHVLGPQPLFWALPVCNSSSDGWDWDVSTRWIEARDRVAHERQDWEREQSARQAASGPRPGPPQNWRWQAGQGSVDPRQPRHDHRLSPSQGSDASITNDHELPTLDRDRRSRNSSLGTTNGGERNGAQNWNDIPDEYLAPRASKATTRSQSPVRASKGKGD